MLPADVTFQQATVVIRKLVQALAIQRCFNFGSNGLNLEGIPFAEWA